MNEGRAIRLAAWLHTNMKTNRAKFCRYIPDFHGSPVWLDVEEAERLLREANAYLDRMIALSVHPKDKAYWQSKHPRIEYVSK